MPPQPICRPYSYTIDYDRFEDTFHILVPVTDYPEDDGGFTVFVMTALRRRHDGSHELSYGAWCYHTDTEEGWAEFDRARCKALFHPHVLPDILSVVRRSTRKLIGRVRPSTIYRRTYEPMPWGWLPQRYHDTTREVNRCGYEVVSVNQCIDSRRWQWEHDALPDSAADTGDVDSVPVGC